MFKSRISKITCFAVMTLALAAGLFLSSTPITAGGIYGNGRNILLPIESNGARPVNIQDQHSRILDLSFISLKGQTTLLSSASPEDETIDVSSTTGFVDGNTVGIFDTSGNFFFGHQIGPPVGDTVQLDRPLDIGYAAGVNVITASHHMNIDGSVTRQVFQIGPIGTEIEVDVTRVLGYLEDATSMDDAKFGGLPALTYGIQLRKNNGYIQNIWNVKTNGEIGLLCFDSQYTARSPAGFYGFRFRNTFAGQSKHGVTIRLMPGEKLEILILDDLTGLTDFQMMAQGHVVTN